MPFIEVRNVAKSFAPAAGPRHVLGNVSISVERGEFVSIVGAMGSGKSTLLGIVAGLTEPDAGTVSIDGEPVRGIRPDAAFVFQNYSLLPWLTALENVRLAIQAAFPDRSRSEQRELARRSLEQVGLGHALSRRPPQLSGGMRQRVAIARALVTRPQILFLDDPFGALDALTRDTLRQELARLCGETDRPVTTIMITNSIDEAVLLSDRIVPLVPGSPATAGAPIRVNLSRPRNLAYLAQDEHAARVRGAVIATLTASIGRGRNGHDAVPARRGPHR